MNKTPKVPTDYSSTFGLSSVDPSISKVTEVIQKQSKTWSEASTPRQLPVAPLYTSHSPNLIPNRGQSGSHTPTASSNVHPWSAKDLYTDHVEPSRQESPAGELAANVQNMFRRSLSVPRVSQEARTSV